MNAQLIATCNLPPELTAHNNRVYRLHRALDDGVSVLVLTDWGAAALSRGAVGFLDGAEPVRTLRLEMV